MAELVKIEEFLMDFIATIQMAKLYSLSHPEFISRVDNTFSKLKELLANGQDIIIGIIGEELAFDKEIFFDLSRNAKFIVSSLKQRGIEKVVFKIDVNKEEFIKFIDFLVLSKEEINAKPEDYLINAGINNIIAGKIQETTSPHQELKRSISYLNFYKDSLDNVTSSFEKILDGKAFDYQNLRFNIANIMENLVTQYQEFLRLALIKRYDITTFVHLLNVCIISMYFSSRLGFKKEDVVDIGIAGLFHDIGKLYISRRIIKKENMLTEEEFEKIKSHTTLGTEILLKSTENFGILPVVVCFEHHLRYNLEGYPKLAYPCKPHIASLIVSICDVYDAICQRRSYKRDYPPDEIYKMMTKERGRIFEPRLLDRFFQIFGVWPIGSIVSLSDLRIAIVREENELDIFSPKVEAVFPKQDKELIDLSKTKDTLKIEFALNPFSKGKDFIHLI